MAPHSVTSVGLVPLQDLGDGVVHFLGGQLGEHRQRDAARPRCVSAFGERADDAAPLAPGIAFLLVDGDGVVASWRRRRSSLRNLSSASRCAGSLGLDDVEVIDVTVAGRLVGQRDVLRALQALACSGPPTARRWSVHSSMCFSLALSMPACRSSRRLLKPKLWQDALVRSVVAQLADAAVDLRRCW